MLFLLCAHAAAAIQPRIIGGIKVDTPQWPATVAVEIDYSYLYLRRCGGTLIDSKWVLTAAHCFYDSKGSRDGIPSNTTVRAGMVNLDDASERLIVQNIIIHPAFQPGTGRFDSDIALLELARDANQPVIPIYSAPPAPGTLATVVGWGVTQVDFNGNPVDASLSKTLRAAELPIVSDAVCRSAMQGVTANMVCAGYAQGGVDSCQGDSGGPLMVKVGDQYQQVGIVSFGDKCAQPNKYGVYTELAMFTTWINDYVPGVLTAGDGFPRNTSSTVSGDSAVDASSNQPRQGGGAFGLEVCLLGGLWFRRWRVLTAC